MGGGVDEAAPASGDDGVAELLPVDAEPPVVVPPGDDGVAGVDDVDDVELVSSACEHPAAASASAASSNVKVAIVFMPQVCNGPIALWQPQAYNDCP